MTTTIKILADMPAPRTTPVGGIWCSECEHEKEVADPYEPGRKQMREIKEQVTDTLLPKAFSQYRDTRVWIDTRNHWLVIDASSGTRADEVIGALAKVIDPLPPKSLYPEQSPAVAMTEWLLADEAPAMFSIDQDMELQSSSENKATIKYVRQSPELADTQKHVQSGELCTKLALTWSDRVSFVHHRCAHYQARAATERPKGESRLIQHGRSRTV